MLEVAQRKPGASNARSGDNNEEECYGIDGNPHDDDGYHGNHGNHGNADGDVIDRRQQVQIVDDREEPRAKSGCCATK